MDGQSHTGVSWIGLQGGPPAALVGQGALGTPGLHEGDRERFSSHTGRSSAHSIRSCPRGSTGG